MIYLVFTVAMITFVEFIAIMFSGTLLTHVIITYLLPTLAEEWSSALAIYIAAFVAGMVVPYFARNEWMYCHLLTFIAFAGTFYFYEEAGF